MATILFFNQPEQGHINPTLRQAGGYVRAADEIEQFMLDQTSKHLKEKS